MFTSVIKHFPGQRKELFADFASLSTFDDLTAIVKELELEHLPSLEQAAPPDYLLLDENEGKRWDERSIRICFRVYCHLLPQQVDPMKQSSIPVNDIVQLVKQYPRNAEALIPRILEPWLDKNSLNAELVNAVT
ncbi:hypothetical protein T4B_628 [Trichinella pseudospiralis]|uniref:Uncharacterized protein n=2 Tax=Trichinella pseudospiralis TaxID=6337 RepID=A0A0V1K2B5_TRIPS|nr:hypothetical protein T4E_10854 [Trichinella pseudospiralis]KRY91884.1 hypothetical protein T4D_5401 [Trichinella pseudospiralis]KRZ24905.1 hypothetical protein T4B_628 [Trichinella pseudospiralis]KRZ41254.1 hypothetical protein T4C_9772 [Trichinella pseudospiralis]